MTIDHPDQIHAHTSRCYWDLYRCAWRCPSRTPAAEPANTPPTAGETRPA